MEIIVSLVLLGILSLVGTTMISGSFNTTRFITNEHLVNSMARYAMERMVRDIREVSYDTSTKVLGINSKSSTSISFGKSEINGSTTSVIYSYADSAITMNVAGTVATLANQITDFSLTYLDVNNGTPVTDQNVCSVRITLTATPSQARPITLTTQVRLRNINPCKP